MRFTGSCASNPDTCLNSYNDINGNVTVVLDGVTVTDNDLAHNAAFSIQGSNTLTLDLKGTNTFTTTHGKGLVHLAGMESRLVIKSSTGDGKLILNSNTPSRTMLGIHGAYTGMPSGTNFRITVESGTLEMGDNASLGGSDNRDGENGGKGYSGGRFIIKGGRVIIRNAIKGGYSNTGTGGYAPDLEVFGGTVTISQWLPGNMLSDRKGLLWSFGGSLNFTHPTYGTSGMGGITPYVLAEKLTITLPASMANRKVECIEMSARAFTTGDGSVYAYGIRDVYVSADSKLYIWFPPRPAATAVEVTVNGCTPAIGTIPANGTSATLNFKTVDITYKCVGVGCRNPGTNVATGQAAGRCE